jgi:hypothetical protein
MVAGAMTAFGWVTSPDPRQYIGDMLNAVPVYGRQILAEYPQEAHQSLVQVENNPFHAGPRVLDTHLVCPGHTTSLSWTHTQSVLDTPAPSSTQPGVPQALKFLLRGLQDYVTTLHPHGLVWNTKNTGAAAPRRRSPHKQQVLAPSHRARFCTQLHHLVFLRPRSVNAHSHPRSLSRFTLPLAGARHGGGPPPPPSRTDWTRLVPPPVLIGHVQVRDMEGKVDAREMLAAFDELLASQVPFLPPPLVQIGHTSLARPVQIGRTSLARPVQIGRTSLARPVP